MRVTGLGHSSFLLEIDTPDGEPLRLLGDPWLSDYLIGDLLGRFPRVRFDTKDLAPLEAIWISHSHTDHFDPYALVRLWRELPERPRLILPQSLLFLHDLVVENLEGVEPMFLREGEAQSLRGVKLRAFFNRERRPTNEDDVMVLVVDNGREVFLDESDALLPFYDPDVREELTAILCAPEVETACFLAIRNEGGATMSMLSASAASSA